MAVSGRENIALAIFEHFVKGEFYLVRQVVQDYTERWEPQPENYCWTPVAFAQVYTDVKVVVGATAFSTRKSMSGVVQGWTQNAPAVFSPSTCWKHS